MKSSLRVLMSVAAVALGLLMSAAFVPSEGGDVDVSVQITQGAQSPTLGPSLPSDPSPSVVPSTGEQSKHALASTGVEPFAAWGVAAVVMALGVVMAWRGTKSRAEKARGGERH